MLTKNLFPSLLLLLLLSSCTQNTNREIQLEGNTMGTQYHVRIAFLDAKKPDLELPKKLQAVIDKRLQEINQQLSTYISDSSISRFNQQETSDWFPISQVFMTVLESAQQVSQNSKGAFDVTVMPLVELWGFANKKREKFPDKKLITHMLKQIGYQNIEINPSTSEIRKLKPELRIDFSAIAKGYAVDDISTLLKSQEYNNFLVEIGGEIYAQGQSVYKRPWRIAVEKPISNIRAVQQGLELKNIAVATSGDYRNYFEKNGVRYSHTVNPKTGEPIKHKLASVTVLHPSAMMADAHATALMVLGEQKGKEYAKQQNLSVYMIFREEDDFSIWHNLPNKFLLK